MARKAEEQTMKRLYETFPPGARAWMAYWVVATIIMFIIHLITTGHP